jgi:integrase/recombinase XerC
MSSEIVLRAETARAFPSITEGLRKAQEILDGIHSFEDIERVFLQGAGLSPNTYRSYLAAVRQFYEFTGGLHPLQVKPGDIEAFYDEISKRVDRSTAALRIVGLKRFFAGIRNVLPIYTSPFELMTDKLRAKLNRTKRGRSTKKALTVGELVSILNFLKARGGLRDLQDRAAIYMLAGSGLRAAELCGLRWRDLDQVDGVWIARFTGKGDKGAEQEIYAPAVEATLEVFRRQHRRDPRPEDALFYTIPIMSSQTVAPMKAHTLWARVAKVGELARAEGILTRELQFSPHLFRRSYATTLYKSGMGLKAIQEKTRHSNIETLTRHYIDDAAPATPFLRKAFEGLA